MYIVVFSQKGGVSKSTSTVNIAAQLAVSGRPGIVVDLDAQQLKSMRFTGSIPGVTFQTTLPPSPPESGFVIVDTGPHIVGTTRDALNIADLVLVPTTPLQSDLDGANDTFASLLHLHRTRPEMGVLSFLSMVAPRPLASAQKRVQTFTAKALWPVSENVISLREYECEVAYDKREPLPPTTTAYKEYAALTREIEGLFEDA